MLRFSLLSNAPEYHRKAFWLLCSITSLIVGWETLVLQGTLWNMGGVLLCVLLLLCVSAHKLPSQRLAYIFVYGGGALLLMYILHFAYGPATIALAIAAVLLGSSLLLPFGHTILLTVLLSVFGGWTLVYQTLPTASTYTQPALVGEGVWLSVALLSTISLHFIRQERVQREVDDLRLNVARLMRLNESILQNTSDGVAIQDLEGRFTFFSQTGAALLGYTSEELIGKQGVDLVPAHEKEKIIQADQRRQQGITDSYEIQLLHKSGRRLDVVITGSPYYEDGELVGYLSVFTNISPIRQAQRIQENTARRLQILHDMDRRILDAHSPSEIAAAVLPYLERLLPVDRASVVQYDFPRNMALVLGRWEREQTETIPVQVPLEQFAHSPALQDGKPRVINNLAYAVEHGNHHPSGIERTLLAQGYQSIANIPLLGHDKKLIGVMNLACRQTGAYTTEHIHTATEIATPMALAIQQSLLLSAEQQHRRLAETLQEATASLSHSLDMNKVLDSILACAAKVLPYDSANILLCEKSGFRMLAARGSTITREIIPYDHMPYLRQLLQEKRPKIVPNTRHAPLWRSSENSEAERTWMGIPLLAHEEVIGVLNLHRNQPMAYRHADATLAATFATQAALAIHNARLFQAEQRRRIQMETLRQASLQMTANLDLQETLEGILSHALSISHGYDAHIFLYDGKRLHFGAAMWASKRHEQPYKNPRPDGITHTTVRRGEKIIVSDFSKHPLFINTGWEGAIISLPLSIGQRIVGVMNVAHQEVHEFNEDEVRALELLADQAAIALENARLYTQLQTQVRRLSVLRTIDRAITASMDRHLTLSILLEQITTQIDVDAAAIWLMSATHSLEIAAHRGLEDIFQDTRLVQLGHTPIGKAALTRKTVFYASRTEFPTDMPPVGDFQTYGAVPLIAKGVLHGVLEVYRKETPQNPDDWLSFVEAVAGQAAIAVDNAALFSNLQQSNVQLALAYEATLEGWSRALELRDQETEGHTRRVTELTMELAHRMEIAPEEMVHLRRGALLHDIGKMGIPDHILLKPEPLSPEERAIMETHPVLAYNLLKQIPFLEKAMDIPYCHHEKWDGSGYPRGLKGEEIPMAARIFAVVDVWDALTSDRPYRHAWEEEKVKEYIRTNSGKHFDPSVVQAFLELLEEKQQTSEVKHALSD